MPKNVGSRNGQRRNGKAEVYTIKELRLEFVKEFLVGRPFRIKLDPTRSPRSTVRKVVGEAVEREEATPGEFYACTVVHSIVPLDEGNSNTAALRFLSQ